MKIDLGPTGNPAFTTRGDCAPLYPFRFWCKEDKDKKPEPSSENSGEASVDVEVDVEAELNNQFEFVSQLYETTIDQTVDLSVIDIIDAI